MRPSKTAREEAEALFAQGLRFCTMCRESLPVARFDSYKNGLFGLRSNCKSCMNARSRVQYHKTKDLTARAKKRQEWRDRTTSYERRLEGFRAGIKTRYGLTLEDWEFILRDQTGRCEICSEPMVRPHIDHCHETGSVRGMLCDHCNRGLGGFRDNPEYLASAVEFLARGRLITPLPSVVDCQHV
jgi:hypothetical protein